MKINKINANSNNLTTEEKRILKTKHVCDANIEALRNAEAKQLKRVTCKAGEQESK